MTMKLIALHEASNKQLDWLVAKCENQIRKWYITPDIFSGQNRGIAKYECANNYWRPTSSWGIMGPIMAREEISLNSPANQLSAFWCANSKADNQHTQWDHNPLLAVVRCLIEFKMGAIVEVPEELE